MLEQDKITAILKENERLRKHMATNEGKILELSNTICRKLCPLERGMVVTHPDFPPTGAKVMNVYPRGPYINDDRVGFHIKIQAMYDGELRERTFYYYEPQEFVIVSE